MTVNKAGEVTIERFSEILEWLGPLTSNGKLFFRNIKRITRLPYTLAHQRNVFKYQIHLILGVFMATITKTKKSWQILWPAKR